MTISDAIRARVIQQMFEGYSIRESFASLRRFIKSETTIGNIRNEFNEYEALKEAQFGPKEGLEIAARDWDVTPTVSRLVAIGEAAKKAKVELYEWVEGVSVARAIKQSRLDSKNLPRFLRELYQRATEKGYTIDAILAAFEEITDMTQKYGPYEDAKKEWTRVGFELPQKQAELKDIEERTVRAAKEEERVLARENATKEQIAIFKEARDLLASYGLTLDDHESAKNVLSNLKDQEYSAKKVVSKLKKVDGLDGRLSAQKGELAKGETRLEEQARSLKETKSGLTERRSKLDGVAHELKANRGELGRMRAQLKYERHALGKVREDIRRVRKKREEVILKGRWVEKTFASFRRRGIHEARVAAILAEIEKLGSARKVLALVKLHGSLKRSVTVKEKALARTNLRTSALESKSKAINLRIESENAKLAALLKRMAEAEGVRANLEELRRAAGKGRRTLEAIGRQIQKQKVAESELQKELARAKEELKATREAVADLLGVEAEFDKIQEGLETLRGKTTEEKTTLKEAIRSRKETQLEVDDLGRQREKLEEGVKGLYSMLDQIDRSLSEHGQLKIIEKVLTRKPVDIPSCVKVVDTFLSDLEAKLSGEPYKGRPGVWRALSAIRALRRALERLKGN